MMTCILLVLRTNAVHLLHQKYLEIKSILRRLYFAYCCARTARPQKKLETIISNFFGAHNDVDVDKCVDGIQAAILCHRTMLEGNVAYRLQGVSVGCIQGGYQGSRRALNN